MRNVQLPVPEAAKNHRDHEVANGMQSTATVARRGWPAEGLEIRGRLAALLPVISGL